MNAPRLFSRASCHAGSVMRLLLLMGIMLGGAAESASANESPVACITSVTPPSPRVGQSVTVSGSCSDDDDGFLTRYEWTFSDGLFSKTSNQASVTRTFDAPDIYTVMLRVKDNDGAWSIRKKRKFTVTAATFTVNVLPSAGCAVTAGDGGVDAVEAPNGIVCSGTTAASDPLCTEQFKQSAVATLKVVPEAGYVFTGWTVNGGQIKTTSAETLFLTTMPRLAQMSNSNDFTPTPIYGNKADVEASCSAISLSLRSITFSGMEIDIVRDDGSLYPKEPHWQASTPSDAVPLAFTRNATMQIKKATFQITPTLRSECPVFIFGEGPEQSDGTKITFPPRREKLSSDGTTLILENVSAEYPLADHVAIFGGNKPKMVISWKYTGDAVCVVQPDTCEWTPIGDSEHLVYVTMNTPKTTVYHTLVHLGCEAADGINGSQEFAKDEVLNAIWKKTFQRDSSKIPPMEVRRVRRDGQPGEPLMYYGKWENGKIVTTAELLKKGDGTCTVWTRFFIDVLKVQGLEYDTYL